jgi:methylenetetrahydrofolate dehydrogenase (NADP+)/methenyltetrahydrofolate cyclohydrolase
MGELLYGRELANNILKEIKSEILQLRGKGFGVPGLAVILIGNDPASHIYVRNKKKASDEVGINSFTYILPENIKEEDILCFIKNLNDNKEINGILVQLPLPSHIREENIIETISPIKDVDAFHPFNVSGLLSNEGYFIPCTPGGIIELLDWKGIDLYGKDVAIVGTSNIVGKPLGLLFINRDATVRYCHEYTKDINEITSKVDLLVTAVGKPKLIKKNMVKEGAIIIDVGISFIGGKTTGDVDIEEVIKKASIVTPVPGGIGPLTIAILLKNTVRAFKLQKGVSLH